MINTNSSDELHHFEVIAQAEGVIANRYGVTIDEAAVILRAEAATQAEPVSKAAVAIVQPLREATKEGPDTDARYSD